MKTFDWNSDKNQEFISERNISFEEVIFYLQSDGLLDDVKHPNDKDYPSQRMFIVKIEDCVYLVPYVENKDEIFLKTIIPSH